MRALAAMLVSVLASCTAEAGLVIDLRTDFVPGFDFVSAETTVSADGAVILTNSRAAFTIDDWLEGQRVAEVRMLRTGDVLVQIELIDRDGATLATQATLVTLERDQAVTVSIMRSCLGVACPGAADPPEASSCVSGRCVDPGCTPESPERCPPPFCTADADCAPGVAACSGGVCVDGQCFVGRDDSACTGCGICNADVGCELPPVQICGDANGDGRVDMADVGSASLQQGGAPTCAGADVLADGTITLRDVIAVAFILSGVADPARSCEPCTLACGDADGDGDVTVRDATRIGRLLDGTHVGTACEAWAADTDGDGDYDEDDGTVLTEILGGDAGACAP